MDGPDVAETPGVFRQHVRREVRPGSRADLKVQVVVDKTVRISGKGSFREPFPLDVKEPVPVLGGKLFICLLIHVVGGNDVHEGAALNFFRVVHDHTVQYPCAPIMPGHMEALKPQRLHDPDLVIRHGPFRIIGVVGEAFRFAAVPVTPQVSDDDGVVFGQFRGQETPHQVCLRVAVDKQDGFRAAAADQRVDFNAGLNLARGFFIR